MIRYYTRIRRNIVLGTNTYVQDAFCVERKMRISCSESYGNDFLGTLLLYVLHKIQGALTSPWCAPPPSRVPGFPTPILTHTHTPRRRKEEAGVVHTYYYWYYYLYYAIRWFHCHHAWWGMVEWWWSSKLLWQTDRPYKIYNLL